MYRSISNDDKISILLKDNNIKEAKDLLDLLQYKHNLTSCFSLNKEFTEYAFEKYPNMFYSVKGKYNIEYSITNTIRFFDVFKFDNSKLDLLLDDLFDNENEKGILKVLKLISNYNKEYFLKILGKVDNYFKSLKSLNKYNIKPYTKKDTDFKIDVFTCAVSNNKKLVETICNDYNILDGISRTRRASIVKRFKSLGNIQKLLLGDKITPNEHWRIYVNNPKYVTIEELEKYILFIKKNPKLVGVKNLLKIGSKLTNIEILKLYDKHNVLKKLTDDILFMFTKYREFINSYVGTPDGEEAVKILLKDDTKQDKEYFLDTIYNKRNSRSKMSYSMSKNYVYPLTEKDLQKYDVFIKFIEEWIE